MREIKLTQGQVALVDDCDFEYLNKFKWYADKRVTTFYAAAWIRLGNTKKRVFMHRIILRLTDPKIKGDHISGNGLDNRRSNLRPATDAQSAMNRGVHSDSKSRIKGVSWHKQLNKWKVQIKAGGKNKHLGCFISKIEAAEKYNEAAIKYHGEFAKLNILNDIRIL